MRKIINEDILSDQIKLQQERLSKKVQRLGLTHPDVVKCSQELDSLLNKYQDFK